MQFFPKNIFLISGVSSIVFSFCACSSGEDYIPPSETVTPPVSSTEELISVTLSNGDSSAIDSISGHNSNALQFIGLEEGTAWLSSADEVDESGYTSSGAISNVERTFIMAHELSQAQWQSLVAASGISTDSTPWTNFNVSEFGTQGDSYPAYGLDIGEIEAVLTGWNNQQTGIQLRLPTSAEWERACREQSRLAKKYSWGDSDFPTGLPGFALVLESAGQSTNPERGPRAVDEGTANALGFMNIHGNLWEWCQSHDGASYVLRGGSWANNVHSAASGNVLEFSSVNPYPIAGVRLVLEIL